MKAVVSDSNKSLYLIYTNKYSNESNNAGLRLANLLSAVKYLQRKLNSNKVD